MLKIPTKRVDSTYREVDVIPQIVHCLQIVEVNPQFGLDRIENIFNDNINRPVGGIEYLPVTRVQQRVQYQWVFVRVEIIHGEHKQSARMVLG